MLRSLELEYILAWERRRAQEEMKAAQTRARRNSRSSCDVRRSIDKHGVWTRITTPALEKMACIEKVKQEMAKELNMDDYYKRCGSEANDWSGHRELMHLLSAMKHLKRARSGVEDVSATVDLVGGQECMSLSRYVGLKSAGNCSMSVAMLVWVVGAVVYSSRVVAAHSVVYELRSSRVCLCEECLGELDEMCGQYLNVLAWPSGPLQYMRCEWVRLRLCSLLVAMTCHPCARTSCFLLQVTAKVQNVR
ncbi:hypothetical protein QJQ45_026265 [Haematococcus lacustris]|nr:hypothetical protein QJQ45_026265 [Haematococcus lacustris]